MAEKAIQTQLEQLLFDFDAADKDKSGSLSFLEVCTILQAQGFSGSLDEALAIFKDLDKDQNNSISKDEFSTAIKNLPKMKIRNMTHLHAHAMSSDIRRIKDRKLQVSGDEGRQVLDPPDIYQSFTRFVIYTKGLIVPSKKPCYPTDNKQMDREFYLRKMFKAMDRDGSGSLTRTEIMDALKKDLVAMDILPDTTSELLIAHCRDDDGKLNYEEFLSCFKMEAESSELRRIFNALDADKSGYLTREEVYEGIKADFELKLAVDKISDLIIHLVKDDDKKISYEEFIKVWQKECKK